MGVIFDLDGVLVDTSEFHKQAWYDLAEKEGFEMSDEFFGKTFGMQNSRIIPQLTAIDLAAEQIERLGRWKEERYRELAEGNLAATHGAERLLGDLKNAGFVLAIGTSTPQVNLELILEQTGLGRYFEAYVTGDDIRAGKPAPDTFLKAAEKLNVPATQCAVIEDAVAGVEAAKAAGMAAVALTTTRSRGDLQQADLILEALGELTVQDLVSLIKN
ncbi:MAG: HAD family hydrolase [Planctomycetota bacterium]|jgi:beta-phosphoglucomutase